MRLFAATGLMLLLPVGGLAAADRYHVVTPSFGCVVPWTAWALNDPRNPHRRDPRWLDRIAERGGCRLVSPIQEWDRVGRVDGLALLRQVPPQAGATPLLFRPSDLRKGGIANPAPALAEAAAPAPPQPAAQPDAPPAAPAASAVPPSAPTAPPDPPAPAELQLPAGAASSSPAASPPVAQGGPAVADAVPSSVQSAPAPAAHVPAGPAAATVPAAPVPDVATPAATPGPAAAPPPPAPAAAVADAVHPPAPAPARATGALAAIRELSFRDRVIGLAILGLLAGLVVLRLLARRVRDRTGPSPSEPYDAPPDIAADEADMPPIDGNAYRRWCVDSLTEAGWQARMSFPAGRLTADIMARRDGRLLTVQCRPSTRPLEAAVVQEALVVRSAQDAQVAAVVSNAGYTRAARTLAAASGVRLLHETELLEFVS